jgi:hypothetical protein
MSESSLTGQERFRAAYQCIEQLGQRDRYLAAYIFGGRQPITENNCPCAICQRDLAMMLAGQEILEE